MLKKILNLIAKLQVKRQNEPIVVFKGKYSYESSLVMRVCELEKLADDALNMLACDAQSYGFGEQYNKIIDLLSRYAEYNQSALDMGRDLRAMKAGIMLAGMSGGIRRMKN